jgi:hypothetical protein
MKQIIRAMASGPNPGGSDKAPAARQKEKGPEGPFICLQLMLQESA